MSVRAFLEPTAKFVTGLAAFVCIPAVVSLVSALWSAATTGEVMVISVGRYETAREMVPWVAGWSRFVGPLLLVASLGGGASSTKQMRWWISAALALAGVCLLFFSKWFTSLGGAIAFVGLLAFVGVTFYVDGRWGRAAAFALMVLAVGVFLYAYAA
jgi:hypothetical protein